MASVNVILRARPFSQSEMEDGAEIILSMEKQKAYLNYVRDDNAESLGLGKRESFSQKQFLFDRSFWSVNKEDEHFSDQQEIFIEYGKNVVKSAIEGYNACVFAYGQTGSGKSYTMMGTDENIGLIPRICQGLFKELLRMREENVTSRLEVSFMEIYNEQCRDLLKKKLKTEVSQSLKVREHPKEGPFVQDLSIHPVTDYASISAFIEEGNRLRVTAGTKMNRTSSRSHSIFMMKLTQAKFCGNIPSETVSKINLVDLAGSERISKSGASGIRLKEGGNINKSLTTLGLVISALAENSSCKSSEGKIPRKTSFVPYRDSVLTWLLKDSIGGNSKTIMIATVSPASIHYGETLSTLRYASRARKIVNKPIINEDPNVKTIRELRSEIEKLRKQVSLHKGQDQSGFVSQKVEAKLKENEEKVDKLTKHWLNKITEAQTIFKEKCMSLSQQGQQTVLTSSKPHLVGLEVDPLSTDIVIYHLEEGKTIIGSSDLSDEQGIALEGSGIEQEHCDLHVTSERVVLHPIAGATYINNQLAVQDWELRQGDVIQFGHFWKFRFHNPMEAAMLREKRRSGRINSLPDTSTSGRLSPAVMHHYRSLDSGLSSPDDFEQDFGYDHCTTRGILNAGTNEHVLNSTIASDHGSSIHGSSPPRDLSLQVPCRVERLKEEPTTSDLVILRSSRDTRLETRERLSPKENSEKKTVRRQMLKSASASDIFDKPKNGGVDASMAVHLNESDRNELYLSADQLTPRTSCRSRSIQNKGETKTSPSPFHRSPMLSPFGKSRNSSASDLSLSTDDLAFNFLLQSQMKSSSSTSSVDDKIPKKLSFPNYNVEKTQSAWDLSPRKFEQETSGDIVQAESLSVLNRRSFNFEEFFVHADNSNNSGSALAQEALNAADVLKEKKEQLKLLIESYREAEISRVEIERENMRRARENEAIFTKQQHHLEDLLQQQKDKLREARADLGDFQKVLSAEKQHQRKNVEQEVDNLMRVKQEHRACYDWSEHELRKKKFKLKVKIEEYWKRMDLYETLLLELELERNKVKQEVDEKLQERIKEYETQQQNGLNEIREQIAVTEHDLETYTLQLEEERERLSVTVDELLSTEQEYDKKISDSERFAQDVKHQEKEMLSTCKDDISRADQKIDEIKEKLHHYTIYKMHECSQDGGDCCHGDSTQEDSVDCNLTEEKHRSGLDDLYREKKELELTYDKKVDKYQIMFENARDALADTRQDKITALEDCRNKIADRKSVVVRLEQQINEETDRCLSLKNELKAHERPRSFISACPEESEEDVIANEQQIEQLLQSKDKVRKILETTLREEFNELKATGVRDPETSPGSETGSCSAVDKALDLVFHAGNSSTYIGSLIKKNNQYEQRRRVLANIRSELQDLMKYQMTLHREVAENFLTQKSLFEEVRSQERKDIHDTIQTLILDSADSDDELLSHIFKESERIIEHQGRLDYLENQMYQKITENYDLQERLDAINEKLSTALDTFSIENTMLSSENPELSSEYDSLNAEKVKCENLINELQVRLFDERKEYLELLRSKDGYDVIGQEYRDERHTLFQTEGNKAAADALREVFMGENLMEALKKTGFQQSSKTTCGGWSYLGQQKDVCLFKKRSDRPQVISMMGRGIIKTSTKRVWETVRNPLSRLIYDKLIKKINIVEDFSDQLKVVYMQHQTRLLFVKQKKDCCCVHNERSERNKFIATHTSIEHPDCPERKNYSRLKILPSGWIVEPYNENGEDWSLVWYLIQIDVGKSYLPSFFIDSVAQKLPLSILSLRDYLILS